MKGLSHRSAMLSSNEIHAWVTKVLVQALDVEEDDIKPSATLRGDLGAKSIDFLDIVFRLERELGTTIQQDELFPEAVFQRDREVVQGGQVSDDCLAALRAQLPYADLSGRERSRRLNQIADLFTVDLLSSFITWKYYRSPQS